MCFLKKVVFWNAKNWAKTYKQVWGAFANATTLLINIIVGFESQVINCPRVLLKTQFYPLINQGRLPFVAPEPFDKLIATKTTKK